MRFVNATSSTGNPGERPVYDRCVWQKAGLGGDYLWAQFAHSEVIAILTLLLVRSC